MRKTTVAFIIMCLVLGFSYATGTDDKTEPVRLSVERRESRNKMTLLQETLKTLREEKKQYYQMRQEWKDEKKDVLNQMKSLELRIEHGAKELETIKEKNTALQKEIEEVDKRIKQLTKQKPLLKALCLEELQWLAENIRSSLPWQESVRLERVQEVESNTNKTETAPAESFRKVWDILAEESALTRLCEVGSIKVESKTGEKEMDAVRLGRLLVLYQSEDQKEAGVLYKDAQGKVINIKASGKFQDGIHKAILILRKRKPPGLVTLPLPLSIYKKKYSPTEGLRLIFDDKRKAPDDKR